MLFYNWPYFGLAVGIIGIAALLLQRRPSSSSSASAASPRAKDVSWLVCLMLPVYMIHQFEEHGIDAYGRHYHFLVELCTTLGHPDVRRCPADPWFILAVNVGAVWIAGLCAIIWRQKNPFVGICAMGIPLINGAAHIVPAVKHHTYNSGLLTAVVLFLPLGVYTVRVAVANGVLDRRRVLFVIVTGAIVHIVLLSALVGFQQGSLSRSAMIAVEVANGFWPLLIGTIMKRQLR